MAAAPNGESTLIVVAVAADHHHHYQHFSSAIIIAGLVWGYLAMLSTQAFCRLPRDFRKQ